MGLAELHHAMDVHKCRIWKSDESDIPTLHPIGSGQGALLVENDA